MLGSIEDCPLKPLIYLSKLLFSQKLELTIQIWSRLEEDVLARGELCLGKSSSVQIDTVDVERTF